jgi:hypothetical protein
VILATVIFLTSETAGVDAPAAERVDVNRAAVSSSTDNFFILTPLRLRLLPLIDNPNSYLR